MFDVAIAGARCAGAPLAMLLARRGHRVLLVDRDRFPSDALSTHVIKIPGAARLKRWGLLDRVVATNCPPIRRITFDAGPFALTGTAPAVDEVTADYSPRRILLDQLLIDAATAAGVDFRERFRVESLLADGGVVCGLTGRTSAGTVVTERARVVVGADGLRSTVAQQVSAQERHARGRLTCAYYTYWNNVPIDGAEMYAREGNAIIAFPTNDNLTCVLVQWPASSFEEVRLDIEARYLEALRRAPALFERVAGATRDDRFYGSGDLPNFFREAAGRGWALAGDAACHRDPITAQGMTDAFRDADLLAEAIDAGLSGRGAMATALAGYQEQREADGLPMYELTCQLAALQPPPPSLASYLASIQENQEAIDRFIGVIVGTVPVAELASR